MIHDGNLEPRLVASILLSLGIALMPWGVRWLAIVGGVLIIVGMVVFFLGPVIWFLGELAAPRLKRLFYRGPRIPADKNDGESFSKKD